MAGFEIKRISWNKESELHLKPAMNGLIDVEFLKSEVEKGNNALFGAFSSGVHIGSFLLRCEANEKKAELVFVVAGGRFKGKNLINKVLPFAESEARKVGAETIRFHTKRKNVERLVNGKGWELAEKVYRKVL